MKEKIDRERKNVAIQKSNLSVSDYEKVKVIAMKRKMKMIRLK